MDKKGEGLRGTILRAIAIVAVGVAAVEAFRWADAQFRYENIAYDPLFFSIPNNPSVPQNIRKILEQPYLYLDRGKQSFAFLSSDGKYVLKFFDQSRMRQWSNKKAASKKIQQVVDGYVVANKHDKDHVGLLYLHLMTSENSLPIVQLTDRFGITHHIDLNMVPFILQKKATPTRVLISEYLDAGDFSRAKDVFRSILAMYADEHSRGVYDGDHNVMYNTGFADDAAMRIDAGRLTVDEGIKDPVKSRQEIGKIREKRIKPWLERHRYDSVDVIPNN